MGLLRGFLAPFRGAAFVARHRLWGYVLLPILVNAALSGTTLYFAARYVRRELATLFVSSPTVAWILLVVLTMLLGTVLFIVAQPIVGAPFCDLLSEKVEEKVRGTRPSVGFFSAAFRSVLHGLLKAVFYAAALLLGIALSAVTGVGGAVGLAFGAVFLAYDGFDYPLARRNASFADKWRYLAAHPGLTAGYGLGTTLLYLIPFAILIAPPFAAAGATLAFLNASGDPPISTKGDLR